MTEYNFAKQSAQYEYHHTTFLALPHILKNITIMNCNAILLLMGKLSGFRRTSVLSTTTTTNAKKTNCQHHHHDKRRLRYRFTNAAQKENLQEHGPKKKKKKKRLQQPQLRTIEDIAMKVLVDEWTIFANWETIFDLAVPPTNIYEDKSDSSRTPKTEIEIEINGTKILLGFFGEDDSKANCDCGGDYKRVYGGRLQGAAGAGAAGAVRERPTEAQQQQSQQQLQKPQEQWQQEDPECSICFDGLCSGSTSTSSSFSANEIGHNIDISEISSEFALVRKLPCGHVFHDQCIRQWLFREHAQLKQKALTFPLGSQLAHYTCPLCRANMFDWFFFAHYKPSFIRQCEQTMAAEDKRAIELRWQRETAGGGGGGY